MDPEEERIKKEWIDWMIKKVKCCACGKPLKNSECNHIIYLRYKAKWKGSTWSHPLLGIPRCALAVICDECIRKGTKPKYALERTDEDEPRYHPIDELEPLSERQKQSLERFLALRQHVLGEDFAG